MKKNYSTLQFATTKKLKTTTDCMHDTIANGMRTRAERYLSIMQNSIKARKL